MSCFECYYFFSSDLYDGEYYCKKKKKWFDITKPIKACEFYEDYEGYEG